MQKAEKIKLDRESGAALMWALVLLIITSILTVVIYRYTMTNTNALIQHTNDLNAFYVAESGIELANVFLQKTVVDFKGAQLVPIAQDRPTTTPGERKDDIKDSGAVVRIIDILPQNSKGVYIGAKYDPTNPTNSTGKFYIYDSDKSNKKEIGEVYLTIEVKAEKGVDKIQATSVGTFYLNDSKTNVEQATSKLKIEVNNHKHIEREFN